IIMEVIFPGDSLVTIDNPIGESISSPTVNNTYTTTSHMGLTSAPVSALFCAWVIMKNAIAPMNMAIANFTGVLGFILLAASLIHSRENRGAKVTMAIGLIFWNQVVGTSNPPTTRLVFSCAKRLKV